MKFQSITFTLLKILSVNAYAQWFPLSSRTGSTLQSVYFTAAFTGYCTGSAGTILKTTNGGSSWTPQVSGTVNDISISTIPFRWNILQAYG